MVKLSLQMMVVTALFCTVLGCTRSNGPTNPVNVNDVQTAGATNNMSYMYRSPPPAAAARLVAVPR